MRLPFRRRNDGLEALNEIENILGRSLKGRTLLKERLRLELSEAERRRRSTEKRLALCSSDVDAEILKQDLENYDKTIVEYEDRLQSLNKDIGKIKNALLKLKLIREDIEFRESLEENWKELIIRMRQALGEENTHVGETLDAICDEIDRLLEDSRAKYYSFWFKDEDEEKSNDVNEGGM